MNLHLHASFSVCAQVWVCVCAREREQVWRVETQLNKQLEHIQMKQQESHTLVRRHTHTDTHTHRDSAKQISHLRTHPRHTHMGWLEHPHYAHMFR